MASVAHAEPADSPGLQRGISWTGAFWIASGVPALVLFTVGTIAASVGTASWLVWTLSILFGFIQAFSYAEIAGLFPDKSGGASVYGAVAWARYSKLFAPVSVWCNWLAWSPVLAIGSGLAAGFSLSILFGANAAINTWQVTLVDLSMLKAGLTLRINATAIIGAAFLLIAFAIQHRGISSTARTQVVLGVVALLPLLLIGLVPLLTGDLPRANIWPILPLTHDAAGHPVNGHWDAMGISIFMGGLFVAAWSTYGFETAVCYTREFRNPASDTFKAILSSGLLCIVVFTLVPISFQGVLGLNGMLAPDIADNMGVGKAMAGMIHAGPVVGNVIVVMMILALLLAIIMSMAGSSRTLYQASTDGWLPRYLGRVNHAGAPTAAMWTDLGFNLILLSMSDYVFVLGVSNVCYILFNFLNLNSAWIHRMDRPGWERPYRAPNVLLGAGTVLSFVNLALMGVGADLLGKGTLYTGLVCVALILPVFAWRHYVVDKGHFPADMVDDLHLRPEPGVATGAGYLPHLTVLAGIAVIAISHWLAVLPPA
ncbi:APC family permease [Novosphingobium sp. FSW06-99]|uniref:APC family permease n=1 Tax=Novosphingobium sp. FSW06-99 TaxID=1739113 RepID=UPI00076CE874|nr:APC family permease [Novosphingobium sp. FSW06-99]KUR80859.1 amino acid permease [Novosphingobium sp. FSW06-99]